MRLLRVCSPVSTAPRVAVPGALLPNFNATRLLNALSPSVFVSVLFAGDRIYSSCTAFLFFFSHSCFNSSQVFFTTDTPPPPTPPPSLHHPPPALSFPFLSVPRSLSYSSPSLLFSLPPSSSLCPPPLSEEIDWVIWLGASSARFLARGKERSGGDMTTCRNNNNIHNIGRVGMDGGMEEEKGERAEESFSFCADSPGCFQFKFSLHTNGVPQHCVSISVRLYPSIHLSVLPPSHASAVFLRLCRLLISNSAWSAGCRQTGVEREDAVFVCRCLPLLPSK